MNREIKFRVWIRENQNPYDEPDQMLYFDLKKYAEDQDSEMGFFRIDIDKMPIMQFTGLLDKNGKEIYEGDIVRLVNESYNPECGDDPFLLHNVFFDRGAFCVGRGLCLREYEQHEIKVVGNIYENPELLRNEE